MRAGDVFVITCHAGNHFGKPEVLEIPEGDNLALRGR